LSVVPLAIELAVVVVVLVVTEDEADDVVVDEAVDTVDSAEPPPPMIVGGLLEIISGAGIKPVKRTSPQSERSRSSQSKRRFTSGVMA
jgi:hypothetical protein